jgi:hypothetical protein
MPLRLRRVLWPEDHGRFDKFDYDVFENGIVVGRIHLEDLSGDSKWVWSIAHGPATNGGHAPGGQEGTLHDAMNAVAAALGAVVTES